MRSLPLFKFGPRARSTSLGIALCTMFIVASFSVVGGLRTSMDTLKSNFTSDYYLATKPGPVGMEFFSEQSVSEISQQSAFGVFASARTLPEGDSASVFAINDPHAILPESHITFGNELLKGQDSPFWGHIVLEAQSVVSANVSGYFSSSIFPSNWMLGSLGLLGNLTEQSGGFNFIILRNPGSSAGEYLRSRGFSLQPMIGIIEFLDSGVQEIEHDANWALIPSVFVIAVLAYSFLGTETTDRRHDIGIIKTVGAGRWRILFYMLASALIISVWGGLLGLALGIVLSYGVSTVASSMFTSVFVIKASESLLLLSFIVTVGAGVAGALIPSLKMTLSSPVEDLKEVTPFS
jgi:hypothetical protein